MLVFGSHASDGSITGRLIAFWYLHLQPRDKRAEDPLWEPEEMHVPTDDLNIIFLPLNARLEARAPKIREAPTKVSRGGSAKPLPSKRDWQVTYGLAQQSCPHHEEKRLSQT
jgi:hypothetical protein